MATYLPNVTDVIPEPALFTPDFSFLDTMLRRRQGLYEQGFAQVNSAYNFVNRSVTNPYSSKVRDTFLKQAQDNLKNLSSLDLSQQQNVRMASGVFEPFVKNRGVLADMAVTAHWDQQESIAESFRLKDGGKEYSDDNINYVRLQRQAFANDDISTVGNYYSNRRSYTPYYDWNKEMQDAMKNFKPSSVKMERINGMYMVTTKDASWTKEEINKYLSATLSDKAKQQMRIEAAVRFPDLNSVAGLYVSQAAQDLPVMENRIQQVNSALKSEKDPNVVRALQEERDFYTDRAKEIRGNIQSIQQGDVEFLKKNAQRLAESIYIGQTVGRIANGFSHTDIEQTIGFNQVAMMYARMAFDREENKKDREKDLVSEPNISVTTPGEPIETNLRILHEGVDFSQKEMDQKWADLKSIIVNTDPAFKGRTSNSLTEDEISAWMEKNPNSADLNLFLQSVEKVNIAKDKLELWDQNAIKYARENMSPSELETYDRYNQEKEKIKLETDPKLKVFTQPSFFGNVTQVVPEDELFSGDYKAKSDATNAQNVRGLEKTLMLKQSAAQQGAAINTGLTLQEALAIDNKFESLKRDYNSSKNTIVTQSKIGFTKPVDDDIYKQALGSISALSGLDKTKIAGIKWIPAPGKFDMQFNIDDASATTPIDRNEIVNRLNASGIRTTYNEQTDVITLNNGGVKISPELNPYRQISPNHQDIINTAESFTGNPGMSRTSPIFDWAGVPGRPQFAIQTVFTSSPDNNRYVLLLDNMPLKKTFNSAYDAYSAAYGLASNPADLAIIQNSLK